MLTVEVLLHAPVVGRLAGAEFMLSREKDGLTQPITSYLRVLNVDIPALVDDRLRL